MLHQNISRPCLRAGSCVLLAAFGDAWAAGGSSQNAYVIYFRIPETLFKGSCKGSFEAVIGFTGLTGFTRFTTTCDIAHVPKPTLLKPAKPRGPSRRLQYPLITEYTLSYSRIPNMI